jgi:hypothetical protein
MSSPKSSHWNPESCDCPNCLETHCLAEYLLNLARVVKRQRGVVEASREAWGIRSKHRFETQMFRIKLALRLDAMPNGFKVRAVFEQWDHRRLMLEMFV